MCTGSVCVSPAQPGVPGRQLQPHRLPGGLEGSGRAEDAGRALEPAEQGEGRGRRAEEARRGSAEAGRPPQPLDPGTARRGQATGTLLQ